MTYCDQERAKLYAAIYEAVDASVALERCLPAAQAHVQRALVRLRGSEDDPEAVRQLERMSVHLHQLTAASLRPQGQGRQAAVQELSLLANQWLGRLPLQ